MTRVSPIAYQGRPAAYLKAVRALAPSTTLADATSVNLADLDPTTPPSPEEAADVLEVLACSNVAAPGTALALTLDTLGDDLAPAALSWWDLPAAREHWAAYSRAVLRGTPLSDDALLGSVVLAAALTRTATGGVGWRTPGQESLEGLACPACGNHDRLRRFITTQVEIVPDGIDEYATNGMNEWVDGATITCPECDHSGPEADFTHPAAGAEA